MYTVDGCRGGLLSTRVGSCTDEVRFDGIRLRSGLEGTLRKTI